MAFTWSTPSVGSAAWHHSWVHSGPVAPIDDVDTAEQHSPRQDERVQSSAKESMCAAATAMAARMADAEAQETQLRQDALQSAAALGAEEAAPRTCKRPAAAPPSAALRAVPKTKSRKQSADCLSVPVLPMHAGLPAFAHVHAPQNEEATGFAQAGDCSDGCECSADSGGAASEDSKRHELDAQEQVHEQPNDEVEEAASQPQDEPEQVADQPEAAFEIAPETHQTEAEVDKEADQSDDESEQVADQPEDESEKEADQPEGESEKEDDQPEDEPENAGAESRVQDAACPESDQPAISSAKSFAGSLGPKAPTLRAAWLVCKDHWFHWKNKSGAELHGKKASMESQRLMWRQVSSHLKLDRVAITLGNDPNMWAEAAAAEARKWCLENV